MITNSLFQDGKLYHDKNRPPSYPLSFDSDVKVYHALHYVFSTPEAFIMGKPVRSEADEDEIIDPFAVCPWSEADAWYIHLALGEMKIFFQNGVKALPFVIFAKNEGSGLHVHDYESIKRRVNGISKTEATEAAEAKGRETAQDQTAGTAGIATATSATTTGSI